MSEAFHNARAATSRRAAWSARVAAAACALAGLLAPPASAQFCPCYTASSPGNTHDCGVEAALGINPTVDEWQDIFALVARGPTAWGALGPSIDPLTEGCGTATPRPVTPFFPCELVKAITRHESGWRHFCEPTTPSDMAGRSSRTIISFDCGYGIAQVTSGMHRGESPPFDRSRVASEPTYNLATGMQIFADKWRYRCVGGGYPVVIEHWYSAVWAYNGFAYSNNPNNAAYSSTRGVWDPSVGGSAPYQEKIFGWMEHPPSSANWAPVFPAYPDPRNIGNGSSPPALPEPACASPTDCSTSRARNVSSCFRSDGGTLPPLDGGPTPPADGGIRPDGGAPLDGGNPNDGGPGSGGLPAADEVLGHPPIGCGCNCGIGSASLASVLGVLCVRPRRRSYRR